ncbi:MAG: DUF4160 domain-containing protein [Methylococcales bacterium]|nr:DUF4160 domain-containing protein [Methylococcales bacterium]
MFFEIQEKHHLPHIHIRYQGYKASIAIEYAARLLAGEYPLDNYAWCRCGLICIVKNC